MSIELLRGKKLLLTGGTGFFGKSILDKIGRDASLGCDLTVLSRNPDAFKLNYPHLAKLSRLSFIAGDIREFSVPKSHYDFIIHAACPTGHWPAGLQADIILKGSERILDFARQCGVQKILFISSGEVYGLQPATLARIPESLPCRPSSEYGIAKRRAELMFAASPVPTSIARCFTFIGRYLDLNSHFAAANFMDSCQRGKDIIIHSDGSPLRSYLYADDLVDWLLALLLKGKNSQPYNVGSENAWSILQLAQQIRAAYGGNNKIIVQDREKGKNALARYIPSTRKIRSELGVKESFSLEEAIRLAIKQ